MAEHHFTLQRKMPGIVPVEIWFMNRGRIQKNSTNHKFMPGMLSQLSTHPFFHETCEPSYQLYHQQWFSISTHEQLVKRSSERLDLLNLLLDAAADVNCRDSTQWTALHCAARCDAPPHGTHCVQRLLEYRADAFAATELGTNGNRRFQRWQLCLKKTWYSVL